MQKEDRGIADPDQAWIVGELIRYLEHPNSGALQFISSQDGAEESPGPSPDQSKFSAPEDDDVRMQQLR